MALPAKKQSAKPTVSIPTPSQPTDPVAQVRNLQVEVRVLSRLLQQETLSHKQTQYNAEVAIERMGGEVRELRAKLATLEAAQANGATKEPEAPAVELSAPTAP